MDSEKEEDFLTLPVKSVIKVLRATIIQGFRLVIQEYEVIADDVEEDICQYDDLEFIELSVCPEYNAAYKQELLKNMTSNMYYESGVLSGFLEGKR